MPVIAVSREEGRVEGVPRVTTRGVIMDEQTETLLAHLPQLLADVIAAASPDERSDRGVLAERVRVESLRAFRTQVGRRPLVFLLNSAPEEARWRA